MRTYAAAWPPPPPPPVPSGFSLVPIREQGFHETPLNAYIAMEKYPLNAYIIFFKNTPFTLFYGPLDGSQGPYSSWFVGSKSGTIFFIV